MLLFLNEHSYICITKELKMAEFKTRIKAKLKNDIATVKVMVSHKMKGGGVDKKTGKKKAPDFIEEAVFTINDEHLVTTEMSGGVSDNPFIQFECSAKKGDVIKISWKDTNGNSQEASATT
jgi:sulfur-oxidizing protein SoxZ